MFLSTGCRGEGMGAVTCLQWNSSGQSDYSISPYLPMTSGNSPLQIPFLSCSDRLKNLLQPARRLEIGGETLPSLSSLAEFSIARGELSSRSPQMDAL